MGVNVRGVQGRVILAAQLLGLGELGRGSAYVESLHTTSRTLNEQVEPFS
jgi:hypothetical protein